MSSLREITGLTLRVSPFIDQGVSQNVNLPVSDPRALWLYHLHAWRLGLKTSSYYTRIKPKAEAIKFTIMTNPASSPKLPPVVRSASDETWQLEPCEDCAL